MITDVHTHFWTPEHLRPPWTDGLGRISRVLASDRIDLVTAESYGDRRAPADRTIVFGLQAAAAGIAVPNDEVAAFVRTVGGCTVGFMSVDPTRHDAVAEVERCHFDLGLQGIKLGPVYQGTSPLSPQSLRVFKAAERLGLPVMIHQGAIFASAGRLADSVPLLLDDVAIAFPDLRIVIAHMGHPWVQETVVVMRRHANVYADCSAIPSRPTLLATALAAAKEYGVLPKVLFGSDSPMVTAAGAVDALSAVVRRMREIATRRSPKTSCTTCCTGRRSSCSAFPSPLGRRDPERSERSESVSSPRGGRRRRVRRADGQHRPCPQRLERAAARAEPGASRLWRRHLDVAQRHARARRDRRG